MPDAAGGRIAIAWLAHEGRAHRRDAYARVPVSALDLQLRQDGGLGHVDLDPRHRERDVVRRAELATAFDDALRPAVEVSVAQQEPPHLLDADARGLDTVAAQDDRVSLLEL